jgi:hypothetical protein
LETSLHAGAFFVSHFFDAQFDTTTCVQVHDLDNNILAFLLILTDVLHTVRGDLGNVNQTVLTRQNGDKGAKIDNASDFAFV